MRRANVYCRGILAGVVSRDQAGRYRFQYVPEYLSSPKCPPISLSFPKQEAAFESPVLFPFFFGLLAEGDDKALQCRRAEDRRKRPLRAPAEDLRNRNHRGGDRQGGLLTMTHCPGCLKAGHDAYCATCRKRLFDGKKVPFILPFSRPDYNQAKLAVTPDRLSISGIQTKISLALNKGRLEMVNSGGQYILKPIPQGAFQRLELVPINEHLTMQMARQVFDLQVAENALAEFADGELAYLVRRFDVQPDGQRSLQEDFAQIAARSEEMHGKNYFYCAPFSYVWRTPRRWEFSGRIYPMVDARFFRPAQHGVDFGENPCQRRRPTLQHPGEDYPQLRHGDPHRFFLRTDFSRFRNHKANSDSVMW